MNHFRKFPGSFFAAWFFACGIPLSAEEFRTQKLPYFPDVYRTARPISRDLFLLDEGAIRRLEEKNELANVLRQLRRTKKPTPSKSRMVVGDRQAPVLIVEYANFLCGHCVAGVEIIDELRKKYGNKVVFSFRFMAADAQTEARTAAFYFEAIGKQSPSEAFRFYHQVFSNQELLQALGEEFLTRLEKKIKVDLKQMKKDAQSSDLYDQIESDLTEFRSYHFSETPSFVINGVPIRKLYSQSSFETIVDAILARAR